MSAVRRYKNQPAAADVANEALTRTRRDTMGLEDYVRRVAASPMALHN